MLGLMICLVLLPFLQGRKGLVHVLQGRKELSEPGVSLKCSDTVVAEAKETVLLTCNIYMLEKDCEGFSYSWRKTSGEICNSEQENNCEWDNMTYVSLNIGNVMEEENYTVSITTDCGSAISSPIRVQLLPNTSESNSSEPPHRRYVNQSVIITVASISTVLIVFPMWT